MKVNIKNVIHNLLCKINLSYRYLAIIDNNVKKISDEINLLNSKWESFKVLKNNNISKPEEVENVCEYETYNCNIFGERIFIKKNNKQKIKYFYLSQIEFSEEIKKYIIKTNVVLDIGSGVRPQTFFSPKVHICIEPFKQYRDIIKPYFPNKSSFIFLKDDALNSISILDDLSVDTIFMLDVLEHLTKAEGIKLLNEVERVARKQIIIFTPYGFYPMHFKKKDQKDGWGLDGNDVQEHKSGWTPNDFDKTWDFYICKGYHNAFLEEEIKKNVKYDAMYCIKTKKFSNYKKQANTPLFVKEAYKLSKSE